MADLAHASENDTDLFGDTDARHWAERFADKFPAISRASSPRAGTRRQDRGE